VTYPVSMIYPAKKILFVLYRALSLLKHIFKLQQINFHSIQVSVGAIKERLLSSRSIDKDLITNVISVLLGRC